MTETKAVTETAMNGVLAMLPRIAEVREILAETLKGGTVNEFQLDRVRVPGAGGTTWTVPGIDGDQETKAIEGIIVGYKHTRSYWAKPFNAANPSPPDCASNDALYGSGDRGELGSGVQECALCPLSQWGTKGDGRRSQACKTMIPLFILTPDSLLPLVISVPPSSLKTVQPYFLRVVGQGIPWWGCVTSLTLERREIGGYPTAVIKPQLVARLDKEQAEVVRGYVDAMRPLVARTSVDVESGGGE